MKNLVIQHFKNLPVSKTEQFNDALQLFRKCPGKNLGQERFFNQAGYTPATLENLNYDLKKLVGITDADIRRAPSKKVLVLDPKIELTFAELENTATLDLDKVRAFLDQQKIHYPKIPTFEKGLPGNRQMKAWLQEYKVDTEATKKDDLLEAISSCVNKITISAALDFLIMDTQINKALNSVAKKITEENQSLTFVPKADVKKEDVFTTAPDEVKTQIKLRDEFPFLNTDKCPEEFYILVGKKFNYYDAWVKAHAHLLVHIEDINQDASPINMTDEEVSEMALKAVENFEVNHAIWKELNHYKATGEILGEHPIFIERKLKESVEALTVEAGTKRISNLENYIRRDNKNAEKAKDEAEKDKYLQKVVGWEVELNMIKTKFNFSE